MSANKQDRQCNGLDDENTGCFTGRVYAKWLYVCQNEIVIQQSRLLTYNKNLLPNFYRVNVSCQMNILFWKLHYYYWDFQYKKEMASEGDMKMMITILYWYCSGVAELGDEFELLCKKYSHLQKKDQVFLKDEYNKLVERMSKERKNLEWASRVKTILERDGVVSNCWVL